MNGLFSMKQVQIHLLCIFFLLVMGKLTPRLCWLLQWWNYCCVIALDRLACAEFKEFDEHKVELNLTWPMVKSHCWMMHLQYLRFPVEVWSPERLSKSQLITIFWHHVLPLGGSCIGILNGDCTVLYGAEWGSWMGILNSFAWGCNVLNRAYAYCLVCLL